MQSPNFSSVKMIRRILRYVEGLINMGLDLTNDITLDLCVFLMHIGQVVQLQGVPQLAFVPSWDKISSHGLLTKQPTISRSIIEVKYHIMANTAT